MELVGYTGTTGKIRTDRGDVLMQHFDSDYGTFYKGLMFGMTVEPEVVFLYQCKKCGRVSLKNNYTSMVKEIEDL